MLLYSFITVYKDNCMSITWPLVGTRLQNNSGDWLTVVEVNGCNDILVRFDTGYEKKVSKGNLVRGSVRLPKFQIGQVFNDKHGNPVELINLEKCTATFRWSDGYERACQTSVISLNTLMREDDSQRLNPTFKVGYTGNLKDGSLYEVVEYTNNKNIKIMIKEPVEHYVCVSGGNLARGDVNNKYFRSLAGVGFIGDSTVNCTTKCYKTWAGMLKRVYSGNELERAVTYRGCVVNCIWHDLYNFEKWFNEQIVEDDWQLDKDLLVKGNKEYGPDYCVFLPREINTFLTNRSNHRGNWPVGVTYHPRISKWQATCSTNGKGNGYIGVFSSPEDAFYAYKNVKEQYAKDLAEKWKGVIDDRAYSALMKYEVNITD